MMDRRYNMRAAGLAALSLFATGLFGAVNQPVRAETGVAVEPQTEPLQLVMSGGSRTINVEIAQTASEQSVGLMFRTELADDRGMLFVHASPRELTMWMRNTYIPLDMVFIRADGTVHRIEVKTEPMSETVIASKGDVTAVLELAGGAAERLGLKPGDTVVHRHFTVQDRK